MSAEKAAAIDTDDLDDAAARVAKAGIEGLPDGKYEFEITKTVTRPIAKRSHGVIEFTAVVLGGECDGHCVAWSTFLRYAKPPTNGATRPDGSPKEVGDVNDDQMKRLKADLRTLGFDVDDWTPEHGRTFGAELGNALVAMRGLRFVGTKKANESGGKMYHNLYVNERSATDGRPAKLGADEIATAAQRGIPF